MNLLPIENLIFKTLLPMDEILRRVGGAVEPRKRFRFRLLFGSTSKPYEGEISGNTFKIRRIIIYGNSSLPVITGTVDYLSEGTEIKVKMRLRTFTSIFAAFWLGIVSLVCLIMTFKIISDFEYNPWYILPYVMFIFGYLLIVGAFKIESNISRKQFIQLFEAYEVEG